MDDIFEMPTDSAYPPVPSSTPEGGKWEVAKLSGRSINVTVRVTPHRGENESERKSVVVRYAPPFVAAVGEDAPFGTFRQVGTYILFYAPTPHFPNPLLSSALHCLIRSPPFPPIFER